MFLVCIQEEALANNMASKNYWLSKVNSNPDLKRLDDFMMEAWSNDATLEDLVSTLPNDLKSFLFKMKIGCPDLIANGFKISFEINE